MFDLSRFNAVLLDMDGVLYRGQMPLPGVNEMLTLFEQRGITYACVTNNSTLTPAQYEAKLAAMSIAIPAARVITSSVATRRYLEDQSPRGTTAWEASLKLFPDAGGYHRFLALSETVAHLDYAVAENRLRLTHKDGQDLYHRD